MKTLSWSSGTLHRYLSYHVFAYDLKIREHSGEHSRNGIIRSMFDEEGNISRESKIVVWHYSYRLVDHTTTYKRIRCNFSKDLFKIEGEVKGPLGQVIEQL